MSTRWKIFRIVLVLHLCAFVALQAYNAVILLNNIKIAGTFDGSILGIGILILFSFSLVAFDILCIYFLQKKYPGSEIYKNEDFFFKFFRIMNIILAIIVSGVLLFEGFEFLGNIGKENQATDSLNDAISIIIFEASLIFIIVNGYKLRKTIANNIQQSYIEEIKGIGTQ